MFRDVNRCADNFVRAGCSYFGNFVALDAQPNDGLCNILNVDVDGLYTLKAFNQNTAFYG